MTNREVFLAGIVAGLLILLALRSFAEPVPEQVLVVVDDTVNVEGSQFDEYRFRQYTNESGKMVKACLWYLVQLSDDGKIEDEAVEQAVAIQVTNAVSIKEIAEICDSEVDARIEAEKLAGAQQDIVGEGGEEELIEEPIEGTEVGPIFATKNVRWLDENGFYAVRSEGENP